VEFLSDINRLRASKPAGDEAAVLIGNSGPALALAMIFGAVRPDATRPVRADRKSQQQVAVQFWQRV
jgi:hypothetical protein